MQVKQYKAKSIQEALSRVKSELGADAMILSTRRLPRNTRDPYAQPLFEVTASAGDTAHESTPAAKRPDVVKDYRAPDAQRPDDSTPAGQWNVVKDEIFHIKDMLFVLNQTRAAMDLSQVQPATLNLYARLLKAGISEKRAHALMSQGNAFTPMGPTDAEQVAKNVIGNILDAIEVLDPFAGADGQRRLAAFIGPTGVGKTTTVAKLAADLSLKQKKRVGIIAIDSYRVGAVEQLKTYAAIMGLPCLPAFSHSELQMAVNKMKGMDVLLIDTAGQSHLDQKRMQELARIIGNDPIVSTHLVLSTPTRTSDMHEAAANFAVLDPQSYIFTKVDETSRCGAIIDQVFEHKLPISYVTNGQSVPEDILPARKQRLLRMILGSHANMPG